MDYPNSQVHLLTEHNVSWIMCMIRIICVLWDSWSHKLNAANSNTRAHTCWDSSSKMWEFSWGRGEHSPLVTMRGYLVLRSTEILSLESAGCLLLCCFLAESVVCFHHLGMQAWKGEQRKSRKAADIGQNNSFSSRGARKIMLSNGSNSKLALSCNWSRSSNKRPCDRECSKCEIWEC